MTMHKFIYSALPSRVIFGPGSITQLAQEIDALGAKRALVLCTPEQKTLAEKIANLLGDRAAGIFDRAVMHVPIETAREARVVAQKLGADCAVAVGGGSTTGLGKAIALDSGLPILAIPTTYAGSEMTPIYGITEAGLKKTGRPAGDCCDHLLQTRSMGVCSGAMGVDFISNHAKAGDSLTKELQIASVTISNHR